jgi:hypothetical protein
LWPQHLLHHLDIGACGDRQARGCVPEFVRCEPRNADPCTGLVERAALKDGIAQGSAPTDAGKDQIIGSLTWDVLGEILE